MQDKALVARAKVAFASLRTDAALSRERAEQEAEHAGPAGHVHCCTLTLFEHQPSLSPPARPCIVARGLYFNTNRATPTSPPVRPAMHCRTRTFEHQPPLPRPCIVAL